MRGKLVVVALLFVAATITPVTIPPTDAEATTTAGGYWMFAADGGVFSFGAAEFHGTTPNATAELAGMAPTPSGRGYWMVDDDGDVFAHGDAVDFGSRSSEVNDIAAFAVRPQGDGYWMANRTGTVEAFGQASPLGSVVVRPTERIVAMASTGTGAGYWMAAVDGGVFAQGDAAFWGSLGGIRLNQPVVGIAATPSGRGYWLVASDGGIFSFGDATFYGSTGGQHLNQPVMGMAALPDLGPVLGPAGGGSSPGGTGTTPPGPGGGPGTTSPTTPTTAPPHVDPGPVATLVGAGDIASCSSSGDEATAALLKSIGGTVFTTGDNAYESGSDSEYNNCYDPSWGQLKGRTRPVVGNHEYGTSGAAGYFTYFGAAAGNQGQGYYSYELGAWHVIVLNSNCSIVSCAVNSDQERWLRADLAASRANCTVAMWHHPRFSSGSHGNDATVAPLWDALHAYGAELVINGHDHTYERFGPQRPDGTRDDARGIREFVIGAGGKSHYAIGTVRPNSEARNTTVFGVLRLTLRPTGYDWNFIPVAGGTFTDSGAGTCH